MDDVEQLNELWTDVYYRLRYKHNEKLTHISVRVMQVIQKEKEVGIGMIAKEIGVSHNTASEHVKRLTEKAYVYKRRGAKDERKVIVRLTELGEEVLQRNSSLDDAKLELLLQNVTDEEKQIILKGFQILKQKAEEYGQHE